MKPQNIGSMLVWVAMSASVAAQSEIPPAGVNVALDSEEIQKICAKTQNHSNIIIDNKELCNEISTNNGKTWTTLEKFLLAGGLLAGAGAGAYVLRSRQKNTKAETMDERISGAEVLRTDDGVINLGIESFERVTDIPPETFEDLRSDVTLISEGHNLDSDAAMACLAESEVIPVAASDNAPHEPVYEVGVFERTQPIIPFESFPVVDTEVLDLDVGESEILPMPSPDILSEGSSHEIDESCLSLETHIGQSEESFPIESPASVSEVQSIGHNGIDMDFFRELSWSEEAYDYIKIQTEIIIQRIQDKIRERQTWFRTILEEWVDEHRVEDCAIPKDFGVLDVFMKEELWDIKIPLSFENDFQEIKKMSDKHEFLRSEMEVQLAVVRRRIASQSSYIGPEEQIYYDMASLNQQLLRLEKSIISSDPTVDSILSLESEGSIDLQILDIEVSEPITESPEKQESLITSEIIRFVQTQTKNGVSQGILEAKFKLTKKDAKRLIEELQDAQILGKKSKNYYPVL